jgi:hypothetical protein
MENVLVNDDILESQKPDQSLRVVTACVQGSGRFNSMSTDPETLHATVGSRGLSNVWVPGRSIWTRKTCGDIELFVACTMQTVSLRQVPVLAVYRIRVFRMTCLEY